MDVLTNKSKKTYDYTSRYSTIPYYYNTQDKRYIYGISRNLRNDTEYVVHIVHDTDTFDSLALKYYGRPDLFWVICSYNNVSDPYIKISNKFNYLYIPTLSGIRFK